jgi:hypothetical protein
MEKTEQSDPRLEISLRIEGEEKQKRKRKKKKRARAKTYEDLTSQDLEDKRYWNYTLFPVDTDGEYIGHTAEDIRILVGRSYARTRRNENGADYINTIHSVLKCLGFCKEKWRRGMVLAISEEITRTKKRKRLRKKTGR